MISSISQILGIASNPDKVEILGLLVDIIESQILMYINQPTIPMELEWIVKEMSVKRYNMLHSEHLQSFGLEGLSNSFVDSNLIEPYKEYLDKWLANNDSKPLSTQRKAFFL